MRWMDLKVKWFQNIKDFKVLWNLNWWYEFYKDYGYKIEDYI